jgi:hypothetical protein
VSNPIVGKLVDAYRELVARAHPGIKTWPIVTGYNVKPARYGDTLVLVLEHTGFAGMVQSSGLLELTREQVGVERIDRTTRATARAKLEVLFKIGLSDMLLIFEMPFVREINSPWTRRLLIRNSALRWCDTSKRWD